MVEEEQMEDHMKQEMEDHMKQEMEQHMPPTGATTGAQTRSGRWSTHPDRYGW